MGFLFQPCERIERPSGGEILRAVRHGEEGFIAAREVYFSCLLAGQVRAWKQHSDMSVNAFVPTGSVRFVVVESESKFHEVVLGPDHEWGYLHIDPGTWFGFQGGPDGGVVMNLADKTKFEDEPASATLDTFKYTFS